MSAEVDLSKASSILSPEFSDTIMMMGPENRELLRQREAIDIASAVVEDIIEEFQLPDPFLEMGGERFNIGHRSGNSLALVKANSF